MYNDFISYELERKRKAYQSQEKEICEDCEDRAGLPCLFALSCDKLNQDFSNTDVFNAIDDAPTVNAVVLPYPIGTEVYHIEPDGVLKGTIRKITVCGYSESKWQGRANSEKDHRFIIFHNSYNQPIACQLCDIYGTKEEAEQALKGALKNAEK